MYLDPSFAPVESHRHTTHIDCAICALAIVALDGSLPLLLVIVTTINHYYLAVHSAYKFLLLLALFLLLLVWVHGFFAFNGLIRCDHLYLLRRVLIIIIVVVVAQRFHHYNELRPILV